MIGTEHFTLAEFTHSDTAARKGIDNTLPADLMLSALQTLEMLERIRAKLGALAGHEVAISISSGYRCPALNMAVGSRSTSDHPKAAAADITAPSFGTPTEIARALAPLVSELGIGQLINEFPSAAGGWCHVSWRLPSKTIDRIITITQAGTRPGIWEA